MHKIMILTDSNGNPRCFPAPEVFPLEETYPYLLRRHFKDATFWQLSYGDITSIKLLSQPMGYLTHWDPDMIIVHTGINDCKPENSPSGFRTMIKKFRLVFSKSKIFWLGICAGAGYEQSCPGIGRRMVEYNGIIEEIYGKDFIPLQEKIAEVGGFNAFDHVHFNKRAHQAAADLLINEVNSYLNSTHKEQGLETSSCRHSV